MVHFLLLIQMSIPLQKELSSKVEKLNKEVEAKDREHSEHKSPSL